MGKQNKKAGINRAAPESESIYRGRKSQDAGVRSDGLAKYKN